MQKLTNRLFPFGHIRNIAMFYVLTAVYNAWFIAGVWIFIWGRFMSQTQIGISDSITFAIGFLIELPSGVMADLMGRRKAIIIGNILLTLGNLFVGLSSTFVGITGWYLVWTIGYAFQSGATEALAYDSLKEKGMAKHWGQVTATASVIGRVSSLIATPVGGILFAIGFNLPYMITTAVGVVGILAALALNEIKVKKIENMWSPALYLKQIKEGLKTLVKPKVKHVALISLTIMSIAYMYNWGILRPMTGERFGFTPTTYAYLLSVSSIMVIMSLSGFRYLQTKVHEVMLIFLATLLYATIFFWLGFSHSFIIGGLLMISLSVLLTHTEILFSKFINEHTNQEHRATTLSAVALFTKMPYVLLALLIGRIAENDGLPLYTMIVGIAAMAVWVYSLLRYRLARKIV